MASKKDPILCPWDHPTPWQPGDPNPPVENVPDAAGREFGGHLARFYETALNGREDRRCEDCAFRAGSAPNGMAPTVMSAFKCLMEGEPFFCHHGDPEPVCAGYAVLAQAGKEVGRG